MSARYLAQRCPPRDEREFQAVDAILAFLGMRRELPLSLDYLRRLMHAFRARVPCESAGRALRCRDLPDPEARVRLPPQFWAETMERRTGGTCAEGAFAFRWLIGRLGFRCKMAINDEGEVRQSGNTVTIAATQTHPSVCVELREGRYAVDPCGPHTARVPLPVGAPMRLDVGGTTFAGVRFHYAVEPLPADRYELRNMGPDGDPAHRQMYIFVDRPVDDAEFADYLRASEANDPAPDRVAFVAVGPDGAEYRYCSCCARLYRNKEGPWQLVRLPDDPVPLLAMVSGLPEATLRDALDAVYTRGDVAQGATRGGEHV